ncbi:NAD(P)/FAD-dependent oxidoreductase [Mangrovibacillus cuniculi]|uniref:FAD-dependent oxidoreductase n=1 Tax=Mangrovibacillus cuniculi TaxID=2593652 RepID=A0A7S8HH92_9BACI|nr:FAD-dependent oxidoreductase [Mangrovibacillus cuniculi]QPC48245.1 FAD-dependent oxidoreductase [Mangrovibacillus cuniculi]
MNIQSGTFYWQTTYPDAPSYPALSKNLQCDVLIVGGGICAAQSAYYLRNSGLHVVLIEKNTIGSGSTSSNTALIQYLGERDIQTLVNAFGERYIQRHLQLLAQSIDDMEEAAENVSLNVDFMRRDTLYGASTTEDVEKLKIEYELLKKFGMNVDYLTQEQVESKYPFSRPAAIYSYRDGEVNPFKYTHGLIADAREKGMKVFEQTKMTGQHFDPDKDRMIISTSTGYDIHAKHVIVATGYEATEVHQDKKLNFVSTYTITTSPVADLSSWYNRTLIWETARPYFYMRTTVDNRIVIGGLDENTAHPDERDNMLPHKKEKLLQEIKDRFPEVDVKVDFALAAFYGGTIDGIPMIGKYKELPNTYFLFAFGDNGSVYGQTLAKLIVEEIVEGKSEDLALYLQDRPKKNSFH